MINRICNLCGEAYKNRHNYDLCVPRCSGQLEQAKIDAHKAIDRLNDAHYHYNEALMIQRKDWWRGEGND